MVRATPKPINQSVHSSLHPCPLTTEPSITHSPQTKTKSEGLPRAALRELRALRLLEGHVHTVQLLDAFPQGPQLALVLEYCPSDLEQAWNRFGSRLFGRSKDPRACCPLIPPME